MNLFVLFLFLRRLVVKSSDDKEVHAFHKNNICLYIDICFTMESKFNVAIHVFSFSNTDSLPQPWDGKSLLEIDSLVNNSV